ncbi:MAG: hypothetical protein RBG13Loki_4349 [Promethearchaeota archaeon CR_4]|nr:MAG: hypothetical protein RBG13Loki_4349 [Candidatus Lokiarchaeota archaeon CR_4]
MLGLEKLLLAKVCLEKYLSYRVVQLNFELKLRRIQLTLRDNSLVYIVYNDHDQYGYQIVFSSLQLDRCRFDNFDKGWNVSTSPHHFHSWLRGDGLASPMKGDPTHDIPLLCQLLLQGQLRSKEIPF